MKISPVVGTLKKQIVSTPPPVTPSCPSGRPVVNCFGASCPLDVGGLPCNVGADSGPICQKGCSSTLV